MSQGKTVLLQYPIEYLIFNKEQITLSVDSTPTLNGYLVECTDHALLIQIGSQDLETHTFLIGNEINITSDYQSKRLEFRVTIKEYDEKSGQLATSVPHQGNLVNYRHWERTSFESDCTLLSAEIEIDTSLGHRVFKSDQFFEFSYNSLSLFIDRSQGLIVPNDLVKNITIKSKKKLIFQSTGKVSRIKLDDARSDKIFIVINLDDPNFKPILDIEPNKRHSDRYVFENGTDAFIEFTHPFSQSKKVAQLLDISNSGISILMQGSKFAMPPGLLIENASMQLPMSARRDIVLRVKGFAQEHRGQSGLKVCMEFVNVTPMLVKDVTNYVQHKLSGHLHDATYEDIDELWQFYFETGFIYKGKRRQLQNNAETIKETFRQLLKTNTPLLKKILYKEDGVIKGNVTAIKVFDHALMVQHLNALKASTGSAAMQVVRSITSYFLDNKANHASGNRYVCFYYRPDNLYPALVFGEAVNLIDNSDVCWAYTYQFCLPTTEITTSTENDIEVHDAVDEDLADLEKILIWGNEFNIIKLECLARETIVNMEISETYKSIGLYRYRRVFVAKTNSTGQKVYAVCSYASPGLNFSELTNSIKLFYNEEIATNNIQALTDAVCAYALQSYKSTAVQDPALLLKSNQPVPISFDLKKNYTLFALDIRHTKSFKTATEHVFANFKEFVRSRKTV